MNILRFWLIEEIFNIFLILFIKKKLIAAAALNLPMSIYRVMTAQHKDRDKPDAFSIILRFLLS